MISYNTRFANLSLPEFYQSKMPKCNTTFMEITEFNELKNISVVPEEIYDKLFTGVSHDAEKKEKNGKNNRKTKKR